MERELVSRLLNSLRNVMGWIDAWHPEFTEDDAWPEDEHNIRKDMRDAEKYLPPEDK